MPLYVLFAVIGLVALGFLILFFRFFGLWFRALLSGAYVGMGQLIGMWLRHVNPGVIVDSRIMLSKAGIDVAPNLLETHFLARGDVLKVSRALVAANKADIPLPFQRAAAIDLAGRDVLEAVRTSVNPKVIDCPDPAKGKHTIDAVAKDGIQLQVKARVTVRANIARLVGGATEETIIARVGEGIVTTIGSSESYKTVLENPDTISRTVSEKGLDAGTAFEILSIDIADIDVGANIGAKLQADQAEADMRRFQAEAEKRRAAAQALEQEMLAKVQENRAKVVLAEAEIPLAIAEAFRNGHLGVMDYYRLKNVQADTDMRSSIGGAGSQSNASSGSGSGPK
ncbi:flotillin-like protein FloA [Leadbettera azotonutricia]|uniref:Flotillin-like protein FloA n=1 Tax=Leadbettera azotonutricia (strain ATCC BAA-888 / DSM 13862 / ZAS-9) TaxID=545695 RepID=F5YDR9_LEAAZ|nr:flotillin-like protein FloA [Leadbettera azotonutricia]AEF81238.1 band 7 protein [Leadbettera azotonutricia ZAS-9]